MQEAEQAAVRAAVPPGPVVVHDVPLLAESRGRAGFDLVIVVDVPPEVQAERLVRLRGTPSRPGPGWPPRPAGSSGWPSPTS